MQDVYKSIESNERLKDHLDDHLKRVKGDQEKVKNA